MKKPITLVLSIAIALGITNSQADVLFLVDDRGLNDSQFLKKEADSIVPLGTLHKDCDIEALDIQEESKALYAAAGDDTPRAGHLYRVDKNNGNISDLGVIGGEIDGISFHPKTGDLWGWAQCKGLFVVQASDIPSSGIPLSECKETPTVPNIPSKIVFEQPISEIEDLKWNEEGKILYAVENVHPSASCVLKGGEPDNGDEDPHQGVKLWAYDATVGNIQTICSKELGDFPEIEGLEILPKDTFSTDGRQDVLALGFHNANKLEYVLITPPSPPATDCEIVWQGDIPLIADVEGMAYESSEVPLPDPEDPPPDPDPETPPPDPEKCLPDRMIGTGWVKLEDKTKVDHEFTLYCDESDNNSMIIEWGDHSVELTELTKKVCSDDPQTNESPPEAGFDTYEGEGKGKLNERTEVTIKFKFTDAGEPGNNDKIVHLEVIQGNQSILLIHDEIFKGGNHQAYGLGTCKGGDDKT